MKYVIAIFLALIANPSFGEKPETEYNDLVDQVLELTGALKLADQMSQLFVAEFGKAFRMAKKEVPEEVFDVVEEEVVGIIGESMAVGQAWGGTIGPKISERINKRLEAMGYSEEAVAH